MRSILLITQLLSVLANPTPPDANSIHQSAQESRPLSPPPRSAPGLPYQVIGQRADFHNVAKYQLVHTAAGQVIPALYSELFGGVGGRLASYEAFTLVPQIGLPPAKATKICADYFSFPDGHALQVKTLNVIYRQNSGEERVNFYECRASRSEFDANELMNTHPEVHSLVYTLVEDLRSISTMPIEQGPSSFTSPVIDSEQAYRYILEASIPGYFLNQTTRSAPRSNSLQQAFDFCTFALGRGSEEELNSTKLINLVVRDRTYDCQAVTTAHHADDMAVKDPDGNIQSYFYRFDGSACGRSRCAIM